MPSKSTDDFPKKLPYFNRELSWLAFNQRVLNQAKNTEYPLLERLRFLAYFSSNLDEFFEIRVAGLMQQVDAISVDTSIDGLSPKQQIDVILEKTQELVSAQYACWREAILPDLKKENIVFKETSELKSEEKEWIDEYFEKEIYPVLTPLGIDHAHPFPQLVNKGLNILVSLKDPTLAQPESLIAVIPVPRILPRVIPIVIEAHGPSSYIFLSHVLCDYARRLFPGLEIKGAWEFRITRNSDLYIDEEEIENLLDKIEEELYNMRRGAAVRLEINKNVKKGILHQLLQAINLPKEFVFLINGPLNFMRLSSVYHLIDAPNLKFSKITPNVPSQLTSPKALFKIIEKEDVFLHHPYDSFTPVVDFIQNAAQDPKVFAIKQTLYRTSGDSPIVEALKEASRNGKQVTALIELKARFDEAANIEWAKQLEEVGVHVVYGLSGLKTHCKCCLVVRREAKGLTRYAHLGTGNYNPLTARTYTDISLFTSDKKMTEEVAALFNALTGFARSPKFSKLLVAPFNLHSRIQEMIQRETENAKKGVPARIIVKINSLVDKQTIDHLYEASQAGVKIDLIIRGICCLIPGVKGLSENIRVTSILGRFLEHSRIYYFENYGGSRPDLYVGSADWMPRNFFKRIEAVFPIENKVIHDYICSFVLTTLLADNCNATELQSDGTYKQLVIKKNKELISSHKIFIESGLDKIVS